MYKLTFKGKDIEPIFLEDEKGKVVMEAYLSNRSTRLVANNQAFNTGDIKTIHQLEKSKAEQFAPKTGNKEAEYMQFRKKMLALPLEQRAKILRIPKMVWSSFSTEEMPEEIKTKIQERQLSYFKEKPNCIWASPVCYKDLIPEQLPSIQKNIKNISEIVPISLMRFVEEMIRTDLVLASK